ncbi:MAG TPA: 2,3-bisphosphoglycerate-independent phosphoglycerate mutase [candidate division Zixibacteria bacterium]|nr:2,3-bisphosphoglycerate-independent phosphoglycerate mutase [candidate division Zixibacteria bacterium]
MKIPRPVAFIIMDGFGLNPDTRGNAVAAASKPNFDRLWARYPHTTLGSSGLSVGLPEGQMGNSEVGHLNFGAGRVVYQEVTRIDKEIKEGNFYKNQTFIDQILAIKSRGGKLHLMGLASDGLVHSSLEHLYALLKLSRDLGMSDVIIHAFLDGRDTSPTAGVGYLQDIISKTKEIGVGRLGTVVGRYYAMDRDKRWERIQKAYDLLVFGKGEQTDDPIWAVKDSYSYEITDEFMEPISVEGFNHLIEAGDGAIFFNFRADRGRQLSYTLTDPNFTGFNRNGGPLISLVTMTQYDINLMARVAFGQQILNEIFGEVISAHDLRQLRTSETEKYPHVTFFFNGGVEKPFEGEDRVLIHSPKVATYDLKPEMSAYELTESTLKKIEEGIYDVIIMNYANCDMVGHTGVFEAARKAVEVVDECVGRIVAAVQKAGGVSLITADHGNAEKMLDDNGGPFTAHTTFPVPFILADDNFKGKLREGGILADMAPTMLQYLRIEQPAAMTGKSLLLTI